MSEQARASWVGGLKRFAFARPVLFSALVFVVAGLLTEIPLASTLTPLVGSPNAIFLEGIVEHLLVGLALVALLVQLGLFRTAGFTPPREWRAVWLVWPLAVIALLNAGSLLDGTLVIDTSRPIPIALYVLLVLAIGFLEETMARGVALFVMLQKWGRTRRGVYAAVFISSALFGIVHLFNLVRGRLPLVPALTQIVYGFFFGVIFAACVLRNNAIWPAIVMHAAVDFGGRMLRYISVGGAELPFSPPNTSVTSIVSTLIVTLPLFFYGVFILRKVGPLESAEGVGAVAPRAGVESLS